MAKAFLRYNFSAVAQDVIIVWYENSAPLAEIDRYLLDDSVDHEKDGSRTVTGINPTMHTFKFYQSSDGVTLETLLLTLSIDASIYNEVFAERFQYQVGRGNSSVVPGEAWADPADGDTELNDERLEGAEYDTLDVVFRTTGPRHEGEFTILPAGGIELSIPGEVFIDTDWIFITLYKVVAQQIDSDVVTIGEYNDVNLITVDEDFDSTHYKKINAIGGAGATIQVTFPALALIPNTKARYTTHLGSQNYGILQFNAGDTVRFLGEDVNVIYLARGEEIEILFVDNVAYVTFYNGNAKIRGSVQPDYRNRADSGAYLLAHEDTGVLEADDYPALYEFIESLPAGVTVALASWGTSSVLNAGLIDEKTIYANKSRYGIDTVARTFRVPHLEGLYSRFIISAADATRITNVAGGRQVDRVGKHRATIAMTHAETVNGPISTTRIGNGNNNPVSQNHTATVDTGNSETTVDNYAEIPLIVL